MRSAICAILILAGSLAIISSAPIQENFDLEIMQRGLTDLALNALGLNGIWTTITNLGNDLASELLGVAVLIFVAGKQVIAQAQVIVAQLVKDLTAHALDGVDILRGYVKDAISKLNGLLVKPTKAPSTQIESDQEIMQRLDVLQILGLDKIWTQIQSFGSNIVAQVLQVATQIVFLGKKAIAQAQQVVAQLAIDLKNHANDGKQYVEKAINDLKQIVATFRPGF